jgi:hypothetical protein
MTSRKQRLAPADYEITYFHETRRYINMSIYNASSFKIILPFDAIKPMQLKKGLSITKYKN